MNEKEILKMLIEKWQKDFAGIINDIYKVDGNEMLNSKIGYLKRWNKIDNQMRTVIHD